MKKYKKAYIVLSVSVMVFCSFFAGVLSQKSKIDELEKQIYSDFRSNSGKDFDYLAIGNSLTKNKITNIWWSEWGASATREENTYFRIVSDYLSSVKGKVNSEAVSLVQWELLDTNRPETLILLDPYLNEDIDLITIQLGENMTFDYELENDYDYMIEYIRNKAPKARIILVGTFWHQGDMESVKKSVCASNNIQYIDLTFLWGKSEYQCGMNTVVYDKDGNEHEVLNRGVAIHPNDKAMKYIADAIIESLE
jgi:hypothetical protein